MQIYEMFLVPCLTQFHKKSMEAVFRNAVNRQTARQTNGGETNQMEVNT